MHVQMYTVAGDPARLGKATDYLEDTVRPQVEAQLGSRGMAVREQCRPGSLPDRNVLGFGGRDDRQ